MVKAKCNKNKNAEGQMAENTHETCIKNEYMSECILFGNG